MQDDGGQPSPDPRDKRARLHEDGGSEMPTMSMREQEDPRSKRGVLCEEGIHPHPGPSWGRKRTWGNVARVIMPLKWLTVPACMAQETAGLEPSFHQRPRQLSEAGEAPLRKAGIKKEPGQKDEQLGHTEHGSKQRGAIWTSKGYGALALILSLCAYLALSWTYRRKEERVRRKVLFSACERGRRHSRRPDFRLRRWQRQARARRKARTTPQRGFLAPVVNKVFNTKSKGRSPRGRIVGAKTSSGGR